MTTLLLQGSHIDIQYDGVWTSEPKLDPNVKLAPTGYESLFREDMTSEMKEEISDKFLDLRPLHKRAVCCVFPFGKTFLDV